MENEKTQAEMRAYVLDAAKSCVCADRNRQYGEPEDNFRIIGDLWGRYIAEACIELQDGGGCRVHIRPLDVANLMVLFKVGRAATAVCQKPDTYIDIAGYAACAAGMIDGEGATE